MRARWRTAPFSAALSLALTLIAGGCGVGYRVGYVGSTGYYDTRRCDWVWVDDGYGGYNQLQCWNTQYGGFRPYVVGGAYARSYPGWYRGPRTQVVQPPPAYAMPPPMPPAQRAMPYGGQYGGQYGRPGGGYYGVTPGVPSR